MVIQGLGFRSQGALSEYNIKQAVNKILMMARGSCGPLLVGLVSHTPRALLAGSPLGVSPLLETKSLRNQGLDL